MKAIFGEKKDDIYTTIFNLLGDLQFLAIDGASQAGTTCGDLAFGPR